MPDSLQALIHDTLAYLRDPLFPKQTIFATAEECSLFQKRAQPRQSTPTPAPVRPVFKEVPSIPSTPRNAAPKEILSTLAPVQTIVPKEIPPQPTLLAADLPKLSPAPIKEAKQQQPDPLSHLKKTLQKIAPAIKLIDEIPDDAEAKKIASAYKDKISDAQVVLIACQIDADTLEFLKNLAKAIDQHLGKTKIIPAEKIESENRWDLFLQKNSFKLIIASDGMQKLPQLMRFYKAGPASSQYFLDKTPLLPLSPAALYKAIEHKALLWKTLCQMLKS